jgi:hypothetical protein
MNRLFFILICISALLNCSSEKKNSNKCYETICTSGQVKCSSNYLAICAADGKKWNMTFCGKNSFCENGECRKRVCTPPGSSSCKTIDKFEQCSEDGSVKNVISCEKEMKCAGGICVTKECSSGDKTCGFESVLECDTSKGGYFETKCNTPDETGKFCDEKSPSCVKKLCEPEKAECFGAFASRVCNIYGTAFTETQCAWDEECVEGFCQKKSCKPVSEEAETAEVVSDKIEDAAAEPEELIYEFISELEIQEMEEPLVAKMNLDGTEINFTTSKDANFVVKDMDLMINLYKGTKSLEIHVQGLAEGQVDEFSCEDTSSYNTFMWWREGKYPQGVCKDYDYTTLSCTVTLDEFGAVGGHVKGTFSGVLMDCQDPDDQKTITDGVFNVIRKL